MFRIKNKESAKRFSVDMLCIVIASFIGAIAVVGVMEPNGLTTGGIVGLIRLLQNYTGLSFSIMYYIATVIVLLILFFSLGFKAVQKAIIVSAIYPTITFLVEHLNIRLLESKDMILAAVFCGILQGVSIGIVAWRGYTFPGTDGLAKAIRKKLLPQVSQSSIMSLLGMNNG